MLAAGLATAGTADRPLHLQVSQAGDQLVITLVGQSQAPLSASYVLDVGGGSPGGTNHSIQRGTARLQPGKPVTIATLRLGNSKGRNWTARLHVVPSTGEAYDVDWQSTP